MSSKYFKEQLGLCVMYRTIYVCIYVLHVYFNLLKNFLATIAFMFVQSPGFNSI